jgi:hypothetical protein
VIDYRYLSDPKVLDELIKNNYYQALLVICSSKMNDRNEENDEDLKLLIDLMVA